MTSAQYNTCVKELADSLYRFARKSLNDEANAEDAVQQAFMILWEKRKQVQPESAKSYLFTVVYRRCMDVYRSRKHYVEPELVQNTLLAEVAVAADVKKVLNEALLRLNRQSRMLVLLKDYEGYRYEEIARLTGLNEGQVKVYLHRARKDLRNYLVSKNNLI